MLHTLSILQTSKGLGPVNHHRENSSDDSVQPDEVEGTGKDSFSHKFICIVESLF
jgi:hypothetical protein